jgi:hypothetical protein
MKTRKVILYLILTLLPSVSMYAQDLSAHKWNDRLLLILYTENSQYLHQEQSKIFQENMEGLEERKLVIYSVMPNQYKKGMGSDNWMKSSRIHDRYSEEGKEFEVVLIGLDGGIKLRQSEILSIEKLFATIDAMPMRRNEKRENR